MVAGLEEITRGELWIDGVCCNNASPKDRGLAMVFQSYALYPHMSVYKNMAFPLTNQKTADVSLPYKKAIDVLKLLEKADEISKNGDEVATLMNKYDVTRAAAKEVNEMHLKEKHEIAYGIRPENIHFYDEKTMKKDENIVPIDIEVSVAELLGHDYYIHTTLDDVDLVSKIPYLTPIKSGDKMKLYFHTSRSHIFDPISEKTIA